LPGCILPLGGDVGSRAGLGDVITASVKEAAPEQPDQEGKVVKAVWCVPKETLAGRTAPTSRFDDNAAVLITTPTSPWARVYSGPWRANCAKRTFAKIVSLAPEYVMPIETEWPSAATAGIPRGRPRCV